MSNLLKHCPPIEALTQAVSEGMSPILQRHLQTCERCAQLVEEEREAASWLHKMPLREPSPAQHQDAKLALFAAAKAMPAPSKQFPWAKAAMSLAAAVLLSVGAFYWLSNEQSAPVVQESRGTIFAGHQAQFQHETKPGDETVHLTEGTIKVDVAHLKPGERFRVIVGDAEVEVRGTSFEVVAHNNKLVSVKVIEGEVEVRTKEERFDGFSAEPTVLRLEPGERWVSAEQIAASETSQPASLPELIPVVLPEMNPVSLPTSEPAMAVVEPVSKPTVKQAPVIKPEEPTNNDDEVYSAALAAHRSGDFATAIKGFAEVSKSSNADLAEDGSYWYADSLNKSKSPEAKAALESFLQKFPNSQRVHKARLSLGKLLFDAGNLEEAKKQFEQVVQSAPEAFRKTAQGGLDAISQRSQRTP